MFLFCVCLLIEHSGVRVYILTDGIGTLRRGGGRAKQRSESVLFFSDRSA